ncbi:hypothetical protein FOTG_18116 [Fusarium oxysporum f. sp. vasinfectum 25433]|uniref:Uncharacterized protein n=1 Tax=Fusarium oxysporum f. sp. vasinfectum 25433 TaxID=1089449 RepID=X0KIU7_FUSOX|nr:hypothetical protein FOTG_18116 [Fusarium oxysporum f. sp. vasinfectum 25433]
MSTIQSQSSSATLLWDHQDLIPHQKNLGNEDLVLLLTPAVVPLDQSLANASDPFEPLGKALARTHPWIRHVPYTKERGITGIHVAFIKRARVVIFVLTGFSTEEGLFQLELAEVARVGRFLHDEVVRKLKKIRGVGITQLGSTFPRLLYGLPVGETDLEWFEKLEWNMKESTLGNGRRVLDWLLRFADHPVPDLASAGLTFRPCQLKDYEKVVEMANKESQKRYGFGWYDQYAKTMGNEDPDMVNRRDSVVTRLLLACRQTLSERGMVGMFVDGSTSDENVLQSLGFCKWAEYKEVWRQAVGCVEE